MKKTKWLVSQIKDFLTSFPAENLRMKKRWFVVLVAMIGLLVVGCGNDSNDSDEPNEPKPYPWKIENGVLIWYYGSDENVTIPAEVKEIADNAFEDSPSLKSLTIHEGVTKIGHFAFWGCHIDTTQYGGTLAQWLSMDDCGSLMSATSSMIMNDGTELRYLPKLVIPDGVKSIPNGAFNGCFFASVTIPNSVTSIGNLAFNMCQQLTSVTIPDSVTSIGAQAFDMCLRLTNANIPEGVTEIGHWAFRQCESLGNVTIPDSVTSIGGNAFNGCTSLASVTIGNGVTSIEAGMFQDCKTLKSVIMPDSVTSIGGNAFYGCAKLKTVTIPASVTEIGFCAFEGCTSLTSVTIPATVTNIGNLAFRFCENLTNVIYGGTKEEWEKIEGLEDSGLLDDRITITYKE